MGTRRIIVIAMAIVAVLLLVGWWFVYPGDLPFTPPAPR
jgi:hypothetical protein